MKKGKSLHVWRYLTGLWTVLIYVFAIVDFATNNAYPQLAAPLTAIYVASLAVYAGDKEFDRWNHYHEGKHPGEIFVVAWTILIVGLLVLGTILVKPYRMPGELISTYIAVLSILAITQKSKNLYKGPKGKK